LTTDKKTIVEIYGRKQSLLIMDAGTWASPLAGKASK